MANNPYDVLGLTPGATRAEINRAFRKLAKQHHPDLNPGNKSAEDKFKTITEAHNQLTGKSPPPIEILPPAGTDMSYVQELEARYRATRPTSQKRGLAEKLARLFKRK
jgi:hypothetical protein